MGWNVCRHIRVSGGIYEAMIEETLLLESLQPHNQALKGEGGCFPCHVKFHVNISVFG